jgi:hypothetical protein
VIWQVSLRKSRFVVITENNYTAERMSVKTKYFDLGSCHNSYTDCTDLPFTLRFKIGFNKFYDDGFIVNDKDFGFGHIARIAARGKDGKKEM